MSMLSKSVLLGTCLLALGLLAFSGNDNQPSTGESVPSANGDQRVIEPDSSTYTLIHQILPDDELIAAPEKGPPTLVDLSRAAEQKIRRAMQTKIDVTLKRMELRDFVAFVGKQGKFPVWINEIALSEEGIIIQEHLTDELHNVTIEQALNWTLEPLGLTWLIDDEILQVTTEIDAEEKLLTRTYDVQKLLSLSEADGGGCADSSAFAIGASGCHMSAFVRRAGWLVEILVQETSGPWMEISGTGGTVSGLGDTMTVRQTAKVQQEVERLLVALNSIAKGNSSGGSIAARPETYPFDEDRKIHAALKKQTAIDYLDEPLRSVAANLAERHKIRVRLKITPLALGTTPLPEEGIAEDEPITLTLGQVSLGSVLHVMLEPLGLTYYVAEGTLWITTEIDAEEILNTAVYDVRDLVGPDDDYDTLIEMIQQETSGPWSVVDGTGGSISECEACHALVVRQTHKVQDEIGQLLADVRATMAAQPKLNRPKRDVDAIVTRVYNLAGMKLVDDLLTAVPRFVAADTWGDNNQASSIQKVGESLIIRHTKKVHEQIDRFLQQFGYYQYEGDGFGNGVENGTGSGIGNGTGYF